MINEDATRKPKDSEIDDNYETGDKTLLKNLISTWITDIQDESENPSEAQEANETIDKSGIIRNPGLHFLNNKGKYGKLNTYFTEREKRKEAKDQTMEVFEFTQYDRLNSLAFMDP